MKLRVKAANTSPKVVPIRFSCRAIANGAAEAWGRPNERAVGASGHGLSSAPTACGMSCDGDWALFLSARIVAPSPRAWFFPRISRAEQKGFHVRSPLQRAMKVEPSSFEVKGLYHLAYLSGNRQRLTVSKRRL
jgi:hypothetical protein